MTDKNPTSKIHDGKYSFGDGLVDFILFERKIRKKRILQALLKELRRGVRLYPSYSAVNLTTNSIMLSNNK